MKSKILKLKIIIASTRPGRAGLPVGEWFFAEAKKNPNFETELIDLAKINLPFLDEPNHPSMQQYTKQHTKDWSALIEGSDAFVFVTPEYNFSPPAALKNALDYLYHEWEHKPVGFVSYGGTFGGVRSVQMLKQIVTSFNMMPIYEAVNIQMVSSRIKEGDKFESDEKLEQLCQTMLNKLAIWAKHLREMRKELNSSPKA